MRQRDELRRRAPATAPPGSAGHRLFSGLRQRHRRPSASVDRRAGAAVREETVEENAARFERERQNAMQRAAYMDSTAAVKTADEEVNKVFSRIESLRETAQLTLTRAPYGIQIYRKGYSVHVQWQRYDNTLRESSRASSGSSGP